jgi:DNA-binding MarR family transcriptional regulator
MYLEADMADRSLSEVARLREALLKVGDELSLPMLTALLSIALEPGISVNDLADRIGVPQQSASRYVALLLGRYQTPTGSSVKAPLIYQEINTEEPRKRALHLLPKGRALVESLIATLAFGENGT